MGKVENIMGSIDIITGLLVLQREFRVRIKINQSPASRIQ